MRFFSIRAQAGALLIAAISAAALPAQAAANFNLRQVRPGIYVAVQRDPLAEPIDGNATIIVNEDDVIVVDTKIAPATTRELIREIRRLTPKPVRVVINTHWHPDHTYGNAEFRRAYPTVQIIAHSNTLADFHANLGLAQIKQLADTVLPGIIREKEALIAAGKFGDGSVIPPDLVLLYKRQVPAMRWQIGQLRETALAAPAVIVNDTVIQRRGRSIVISHLGRANTRGDLVVLLPEDRVVITGDILVAPIPFAFGSSPTSWIAALDSIRAMPADVIIPGHGEPLRDRAYLDRVRAMFATVRASVAEAVTAGKSLDATRSSVPLRAFADQFAGTDPLRRSSFRDYFAVPFIERAYLEAKGEISPDGYRTGEVAAADSGARMERVGPGTYAIIHDDAVQNWPSGVTSWPHGNTGVIVGDDGVLVVDATYLPSRARDDIALIRRVTTKPVRYLVNTHWHGDHTHGNAVYRQYFPGVVVLGARANRDFISLNLEKYPRAVVADSSPQRATTTRLAALLLAGRDSSGPLPDSLRARLRRNVAQRQLELSDLALVKVVPPELLFTDSITVYLGTRRVEIRNRGRANSPNDVTVEVPDAGILFAGDILVHPVPYAFQAYPTHWLEVLRDIERSAVPVVIPGHGAPQRDKSYVSLVRELLDTVRTRVEIELRKGKTAEAAAAAVQVEDFRERFVKAGDRTAAAYWDGSIKAALVDRMAWCVQGYRC